MTTMTTIFNIPIEIRLMILKACPTLECFGRLLRCSRLFYLMTIEEIDDHVTHLLESIVVQINPLILAKRFRGKLREETLYYEDGNIKSLLVYTNKNIYYDRWYPSGIAELKIMKYINSDTLGTFNSWHPNGNRNVSFTTLLAKKHGPKLSWFKNGQLAKSSNYIQGKQNGTTKQWYPNGGIKSSIFYNKGQPEGEVKVWYINGIIQSKSYYVNGLVEGIVTQWYHTGAIWSIISYQEGKLDGLYNEWHSNGRLKSSAFYEMDKLKVVS